MLENPVCVPVDRILPIPEPLRRLDSERVDELANSITNNGLLQPILVRPVTGQYEIIFGYHRLEACRRLGWKSIPAFVKGMSIDDSFFARLVENLQRNNEIDPLAEARGYIALIDRGWTINSIAKRIGKSDSYVSDRVGLIRRLNPKIAQNFQSRNQQLKPSHLELLARIKSKTYQLELSELVQTRRLSVRKLEFLVATHQPWRQTVQGSTDSLHISIPREVATRMGLSPGSQVYMSMQGSRKIVIEAPYEVARTKHIPSIPAQ